SLRRHAFAPEVTPSLDGCPGMRKSPLTPLCKRGGLKSPFRKGGLRGIFATLRCGLIEALQGLSGIRPRPRQLLPLLTLALAVGCSAATPTPEPVDPQAVLRQSVDRVMSLESGAFTLEHRKGTTVLLPGLEMNRVYGVADIPDKFRFTVEAESNGLYIETEMVVIQDKAYMTNFLTGEWESVPMQVIPFRFADLGQTLADIIESVQNPTLVGTEKLKDYDAHRIKGQVRSDDLVNLVPGAGSGFDVTLELWVDRSESLLLQVLITGQVVPTDLPDAVRALTLDDIDVPVDINRPE
ncbi:MAG: LppX_LprAFG lipoprotein, partial [Dehalococcoidia bacterium]